MRPIWNRADRFDWHGRVGDHPLSVCINEYSERPLVIEIPGRRPGDDDLSIWMSPDEARELAGRLIDYAAAIDRAGRVPQ